MSVRPWRGNTPHRSKHKIPSDVTHLYRRHWTSPLSRRRLHWDAFDIDKKVSLSFFCSIYGNSRVEHNGSHKSRERSWKASDLFTPKEHTTSLVKENIIPPRNNNNNNILYILLLMPCSNQLSLHIMATMILLDSITAYRPIHHPDPITTAYISTIILCHTRIEPSDLLILWIPCGLLQP